MEYQPFNYKKFVKSFHHAVRGVIFLLKSEQNARVQAVLTVCVGIAGFLLKVSRLEAAILFMAVILVFAIEIINTAIEKVFDLCYPGKHETIRGVKDAMAGAVFVSALIAFVVAVLVFLPHIKALFI